MEISHPVDYCMTVLRFQASVLVICLFLSMLLFVCDLSVILSVDVLFQKPLSKEESGILKKKLNAYKIKLWQRVYIIGVLCLADYGISVSCFCMYVH